MSALAMMLAWSTPTLLMYLAGMILAVVFWRRCPKASLLCLLGLGLLLTATIEQLAMQFLVARFLSYFDSKLYMLMIAGVIENAARVGGMALLLGAIFSGQKGKCIVRQENISVDQASPAKTPSFNITRPRSGDSFMTDQ